MGSLIHRRSLGSLCANMLGDCWSKGYSTEHPLVIYSFGFITHGILDRHFHPFINYFSGWYDHSKPHTKAFRYNHSFYERILDVLLYKEFLNQKWMTDLVLTPPGSRAQNFAEYFTIAPHDRDVLVPFLTQSIFKTYEKTQTDTKMSQRITHALADSSGFYQYCDKAVSKRVDQIIENTPAPIQNLKWTGLLHPTFLPSDMDFLNTSHQTWQDPCGFGEWIQSSVLDLWNQALRESCSIIAWITTQWNTKNTDWLGGVSQIIGNSDLRNTRPSDKLCTLEYCEPKDLFQVLKVLDEGTIPPDWVRIFP